MLISLEATTTGQTVLIKCFDMSETEVNHLFGKDRVTKNGVYFEATLLDVAPHGWALRRHQLMKSVEKSTRALFLSFGSLSPLREVWVFRRTEAPLNASFTTSSALLSPRPSSPDTSSTHLNASGNVASPAGGAAAAHGAADDDSNDKDTHPKSAKAAPDAADAPNSPTGSTSGSGKKKKSKPKSPKSDDD